MNQCVRNMSCHIHVNLVGKPSTFRIVAIFVIVKYFGYKVYVCL